MSLKEDKVTGFLGKHPFISTVFAVLVVLIATGMQINSNAAVCIVMVSGYLLIAGYGLFLKKTRKLSDDALIVLIFLTGAVLRLGYVLYTDVRTRQNDVGVFEEGIYNIFHSGYIMLVRDTLSVPNFDIRDLGQYYHPPFHYIVCAAFLKIYELLLPKGTHNYEALQALSMLWSQFSLILIYKIVKLTGIKRENRIIAALIVSAFPAFTLLSASINNDGLSVFLYFAAFFCGLKWYKEGGWKNILLSAVATGLGVMTKLSIGMIAFPLGFLFIVKLIKDLTGKSENKAGTKSLLQLLVFGLISVPLGLWYQIRNYILFKVPITYVLESDNIYQDISRYTPLQRVFGFYTLPIENYYINLGSDGQQDYNIFITQVKTALFGEENYRDDFAMSMAGYALLIALLLLILIALAGLIVMLVRLKKNGCLWENLSMVILAVTMAVSVTLFSLKYPHICSMNFRYSTPLLLSGTVFCCKAGEIKLKGENEELLTKIIKGISVAFFILAVLFYTILWTYVKGEVVVVDPSW